MFPEGREIGGGEGKIKEMGKERDTAGTKMFKMKIGEGIWAKGRGILKGSNGKGNRLGGERRERWVERAFVDGAEDATGERGLLMGSGGRILLRGINCFDVFDIENI